MFNNKRGETSVMEFFLSIPMIVFYVILGSLLLSYVGGIVDNSLNSIGLPIGAGPNNTFNQTFNESYQQHMRPSVLIATNVLPNYLSLGVCLGLIVLLVFIAWKTGEQSRLWIPLDIILIVATFILSVIFRGIYIDQLLNIYPDFYTIGTTTLANASKFLLNLPIIVTVIGVLVMFITYGLKGMRLAAAPDQTSDLNEEMALSEEY